MPSREGTQRKRGNRQPKITCNGGTPPGKTRIEALAEWVGNGETRGTVRRARTLNATKNTRETRGILERKGKPCENKGKAREGTSCDVRTTGVWRAEKEKLNNASRVREAAKPEHEAGGSGRTSVEDSDHAAVVAKELYVASGPMGQSHPWKSRRNSRVRRIGWNGYENGPGGQSYGGNVLPGRTTLLAW